MKAARGFTLIELMISLLLGMIITGAIIQSMVSSRVTNSLNAAVSEVQEAGRYIMIRMRRELDEVGRYDLVTAQLDESVDTLMEAAYVQNHPVPLAGDFVSSATLGAVQGASGANDRLVTSSLGAEDCTGNAQGYSNGDEFHVVNHYFVSDNKLKCVGYDGRVLRGLKAAASSSTAITLVDNVESFQVQYGVTAAIDESEGLPIQYVTADALPALRANNQQVVAIRIGLLLKSENHRVSQTNEPQFSVLNEAPVTLDKNHYFQVFSQTLALRNMKNFVRSAK